MLVCPLSVSLPCAMFSDTIQASHVEVFSEMKVPNAEDICRGSRYLKVCGQLVCGCGFMRLMGIGKRRFGTLGTAARRGEVHCPFDSRYIPRGQKEPGPKWQKVFDYLMDLDNQVAEHIPGGLNSNKRPRQGNFRFDNPNMDRSRIKHLPHGSINEYHKQCQAAVNDESISRKLFCSVPCPIDYFFFGWMVGIKPLRTHPCCYLVVVVFDSIDQSTASQ